MSKQQQSTTTATTATATATATATSSSIIGNILQENSLQNLQRAITLSAEIEEGKHEYKLTLSNLTEMQINHRISQLNWRLNEGDNEAIYHIGVEDDGHPLGLEESEMEESLKTLQIMADATDCDMFVRQLYAGEQGLTAEVVMRRRERTSIDTSQLHVAIAGDENSGKSTLIGINSYLLRHLSAVILKVFSLL